MRVVPLLLIVSLIARGHSHVDRDGALLAIISGALASGLGYVAWYQALRGLTTTRAAVVQLAVPILAAGGGMLFLGEPLAPRLFVSAAMVLKPHEPGRDQPHDIAGPITSSDPVPPRHATPSRCSGSAMALREVVGRALVRAAWLDRQRGA